MQKARPLTSCLAAVLGFHLVRPEQDVKDPADHCRVAGEGGRLWLSLPLGVWWPFKLHSHKT